MNKSLGWLSALSIGATSVACAVPMDEAELSELEGMEDVDTKAQEIRSGTLTQKRGVIQVVFDGGGTCTGVMVSKKYAITAGHCVDGHLNGKSGWIKAWVRYYDPELNVGEWRWVTSNRDKNEASEWFFADMHPSYSGGGDWGDDIAVIRRDLGTFKSTDDTDYQRLSMGSCSQIDRNERFGAGAKGFSGEQDNKLRKSPVNIHECKSSSFFDLTGGDQICSGDSGGPHILKAGSFDVVAGLTTGTRGSGNVCGESGDEQWAVRITSSKIDWIDDKMVDMNCSYFNVDGHPYARCW